MGAPQHMCMVLKMSLCKIVLGWSRRFLCEVLIHIHSTFRTNLLTRFHGSCYSAADPWGSDATRVEISLWLQITHCTSSPLTKKPSWPFSNPHLVSFPFYPLFLCHSLSIYPPLRPVGTSVHRFLLKLLSTFGMEAQEVNPLRNPWCQCTMLGLK